ncbi:hypothetical protein CTZ27_25025 [Streptomyces griseocarneus]|nr:hypothetical protein CTZ27_25025 [Streptomyces griseocarneus]
MTTHVFSGPTLPAQRIREILPAAVPHPPVGHGDLLRLRPGPADTILIIDGLWHQSAPVRHKEILLVLESGVQVIGAASMGALRAAELAPYGMTGVGEIFHVFRSGLLDADDEVAVLHTPEGRPLSEALVNLRTAIQRTAATGCITSTDACALAELARQLPFTRRTWAALGRTAHATGLGKGFDAVDAWRKSHAYDLKCEDAERALHYLAAASSTPCGPKSWSGEPWRTSFVRYWTAVFTPPGTAKELPFLALLQHQQIYDPGFPARWRTHVLSAVADYRGVVDTKANEDAALYWATRLGVRASDLSARQKSYWLTPDEIQSVDTREQLLRIMVRSARLDGAWTVWPTTPAEADTLFDDTLPTAEEVAAAYQVNADAEASNPRHTVAHLDTGRIAEHLCAAWGLGRGTGQGVVDAAARDRAFRDFAGAVEVARAFYLGTRAASASRSASSGVISGVSDRCRT